MASTFSKAFTPEDVQILGAALQLASRRLGQQYGFSGSALKSAQKVAADAICKTAAVRDLDDVRLANVGVESVRATLTASFKGLRKHAPRAANATFSGSLKSPSDARARLRLVSK